MNARRIFDLSSNFLYTKIGADGTKSDPQVTLKKFIEIYFRVI